MLAMRSDVYLQSFRDFLNNLAIEKRFLICIVIWIFVLLGTTTLCNEYRIYLLSDLDLFFIKEMTAVFNYLWWGTADPDKSDPVTGLSKRDLYHIRKSWAKLFGQPIDSGMLLFVKLFRTEPSTQDFFVTIKGLPEDKFTTLPQFKAHVLNFMTSLNEAVTTIQEASVVMQLMRRLGRTHRKFHVKPEHFNIVTQVLVDTLKNNFQAEDDVISAWSKLLVFLFKPLFEELTAETH